MMKELETLREGMEASTVVAAACVEPGQAAPLFAEKCRSYLQVRTVAMVSNCVASHGASRSFYIYVWSAIGCYVQYIRFSTRVQGLVDDSREHHRQLEEAIAVLETEAAETQELLEAAAGDL
eukprot:COSAG05_NODE_416_length_10031_cov_18.951067_13_plen_122_part_00